MWVLFIFFEERVLKRKELSAFPHSVRLEETQKYEIFRISYFDRLKFRGNFSIWVKRSMTIIQWTRTVREFVWIRSSCTVLATLLSACEIFRMY